MKVENEDETPDVDDDGGGGGDDGGIIPGFEAFAVVGGIGIAACRKRRNEK